MSGGPAAAPPAQTPRRIFSAFGLTSAVTLMSIIPSVATSKFIAVLAGRDGVALMGVYRNLGMMVTQTLALGFGLVILQKISAARSAEDENRWIGASTLLILAQGVVLAVAALAGAGLIGALLFAGDASRHVWPIRVVLLMALVNHAQQTVVVLLQGKGHVKPLSAVQLAASVSTLALIVPLIRLGDFGLAVNVGSGNVVGLLLGVYLVTRLYRPRLEASRLSEYWAAIRGTLLPSVVLVARTLAAYGALLFAQSAVGRAYGLELLGEYAAAVLICDTAVMVLMASARSYFLPSLGRLDRMEDKLRLFSRMMTLLLAGSVAAGVGLIVLARPVIAVLFSPEFAAAPALLAVLSVSLTGHALIWSYNTFLLHHGEHFLFSLMDALWAAGLVAFVAVCAGMRLPVVSVMWASSACALISGLLYALTVKLRYGSGFLTGRNAALLGGGTAWLVAGNFAPAGAYGAISGAAALAAALALPWRRWAAEG